MKRILKLLGIIAFAAIMGFTMTACSSDDDGDATSGTYTAFWKGAFQNAAFATISGVAAPAQNQIAFGTNSRDAMLASCNGNTDLSATKNTGVTYSQMEAELQGLVAENPQVITPAQKTEILNRIKDNGYVVVGIYYGSGLSLVIAAFKE